VRSPMTPCSQDVRVRLCVYPPPKEVARRAAPGWPHPPTVQRASGTTDVITALRAAFIPNAQLRAPQQVVALVQGWPGSTGSHEMFH
jgi:hypothetical protein